MSSKYPCLTRAFHMQTGPIPVYPTILYSTVTYRASELHTNASRISNNSSRGADIRLNMSFSVFPSFHFVSLAFRLALVVVSLFANCAITGVITFRLVTAVGINPPSISRRKYNHTICNIYFPPENSSYLL